MLPAKRTLAGIALAVFLSVLAIVAISFAPEGSSPIVIDVGGGITVKYEGVTTGTNGLARGHILGKAAHKWGVPLDSFIYKLFPGIKPAIWPTVSGMRDGLSFWFSVSSQTLNDAQMNGDKGRTEIFWSKRNDRSPAGRIRIDLSDTNNLPPEGGFGGGYSGSGYFRLNYVLPPERQSSYRLQFFLPGEQTDWKLFKEIPVEVLE